MCFWSIYIFICSLFSYFISLWFCFSVSPTSSSTMMTSSVTPQPPVVTYVTGSLRIIQGAIYEVALENKQSPEYMDLKTKLSNAVCVLLSFYKFPFSYIIFIVCIVKKYCNVWDMFIVKLWIYDCRQWCVCICLIITISSDITGGKYWPKRVRIKIKVIEKNRFIIN